MRLSFDGCISVVQIFTIAIPKTLRSNPLMAKKTFRLGDIIGCYSSGVLLNRVIDGCHNLSVEIDKSIGITMDLLFVPKREFNIFIEHKINMLILYH